MKIEFNKVTRYSKLLAILLFVGLVVFAFWFGVYYQKVTQSYTIPATEVIQEKKIDISAYPDTLPFKQISDNFNDFNMTGSESYFKSSWRNFGFEYSFPFIPDAIAIEPTQPKLNSTIRIFLKTSDPNYSSGLKTKLDSYDAADLVLIKVDPKTLQPVSIATYGSETSYRAGGFGSVDNNSSLLKTPLVNIDGYTFSFNLFLDSRKFAYDKNYYYMLLYEGTVPNNAGTPTEYTYTSGLFKILPE